MILPNQNYQLLRAAIRMRDFFQLDQISQKTFNHLPSERWTQLLKLERQFSKAKHCGFEYASKVCIRNLSDQIRLLISELSALEADLRPLYTSEKSKPSMRFLYEELLSLDKDFVMVGIDHRMKEVVVCTEQIVLDEVELGRFEIRFSMTNQKESKPYRIVALDPNCPVSDDSVTHPHVQSERLCTGDGTHAISSALADGRLSDLFLTIRQILQTYNPSSAYVSLDDWNGTTCNDCGDLVDSDETFCCEQCDSRQCDRCTCTCQDCDVSLCASCTENCSDCEQCTCRNCLICCESCQESFCRYCLDNELCQSCRDLTEESKNAESENSSTYTEKSSQNKKEAIETTASADNPLQPRCVGEVNLSA